MFGGSYGYNYGQRRSAPRGNRSGINERSITKWRVVCERPLPVSADEEGRDLIYDLEPQTRCDVTEQRLAPSGELRGMIVDPVWKGWITLKTASGDSLCAPLEDGSGTSNSGAIAASAAAPALAPASEPLTWTQLLDLQADCCADDVEILDEMRHWSEDEARRCFETGGMDRPPARAPSIDVTASEAGGDHGDPHTGEGAPAAATATGGVEVEMSERQRAARDAGEWAKGTMILLRGLSSESELNGRSGVIAAWDGERGRYDVRLANRVVRALPANLGYHPLQRQRDANHAAGRGDEVVFMTEDAKVARAGTYAVKLDPQFWYDQALERVFDAKNEFEVLELPVEFTEDFTRIRKAYRKISLSVHPVSCERLSCAHPVTGLQSTRATCH